MISGEPFLDSAANALRLYLPTELAAIDSEIRAPLDDGGAIGERGTDYYVGVVTKPIRYPLVEVAIPDWTLIGFSIERLTTEAEVSMIVMATVRSADQSSDGLYRLLMRYTKAMLLVLLDPDRWQVGGAITRVQGAYRMNPENREEREEIIGATALGITLETTDSREP